MNIDTPLKSTTEYPMTLGRVASSVMDLSSLFFEDSDLPTVTDSEVSYEVEDDESDNSFLDVDSQGPVSIPEIVPSPTITVPTATRKLQWEFYGLTIFLELEDYNNDISQAIYDMAYMFKVEPIPRSHTTAIYGMTHLTHKKAREKLHMVKDIIGQWPSFARPTGVVSDIAVEGRPGQVCSIAWCELTLASSDEHEEAMDKLYSIFYGEDGEEGNTKNVTRQRPWKPHNSIAYDNPEDPAFSLGDFISYVSMHPTLVSRERRVEAISLWDMNGKMGDWKCLDRVYF